MIVCATILLLLSILLNPPQAYAAVVLNEIFPKTADVTNQWIELYNTGTDPVSLDRWKLQNTSGAAGTFMMNASAIIPPLGFLVFPQTQTGITLSLSGDTVRLLDEKDTLIDSQSYPSTLGYSTAYGRSPDGAAGWSICAPSPYYPTAGKPNNCPPAPTPTSTPTNTPTDLSTPTTTPTSTLAPTPTATITPTAPPKPTLVATSNPITRPVDFMQSEAYKYAWISGIGVGSFVAFTVIIIGLYRQKKR